MLCFVKIKKGGIIMTNQSKNQDKNNSNSKNNLSGAAHTLRSGDSSQKEKSKAASQLGSKGGHNSHSGGKQNHNDSDK